LTGIDEDNVAYEKEEMSRDDKVSAGSFKSKKYAPTSPKVQRSMNMQQAPTGYVPTDGEAATEQEPEQETIREGEKKVVYCGLVKTDANGNAKVSVMLPPQTGRCNIRFTAVNRFDYLDSIKPIDVSKTTSVEVTMPKLIMPDAKLFAKASVLNNENEEVQLRIYGAGIAKEQTYKIAGGSTEIIFEVNGKDYGSMFLEIRNSKGKVLDKRELILKNVSSYPTTFSDLLISDGNDITIAKGKAFGIYSNPGILLKGIVANINTTMYSWFGHSEAISSAVLVEATLLAAIDEKIISDEGFSNTLKGRSYKSGKGPL